MQNYEEPNEFTNESYCYIFLDILQLKEMKYYQVDAFDFSQEMLNRAKDKSLYRNYLCDSIQLNEKTQINDGKMGGGGVL